MKNKGNLDDLTDSSDPGDEEDHHESTNKRWGKYKKDVQEMINRRKAREENKGSIFQNAVSRFDHFSYKMEHRSAPPPTLYNPKHVDK